MRQPRTRIIYEILTASRLSFVNIFISNSPSHHLLYFSYKEEEVDDDWYSEDEEDEQPVVETKAPIQSSSKSLDELRTEGRSIADIEAPEERRPSLFDEFNNSPEPEIESYEVETEEDVTSLEEEVSDEVEEDDGISVDENGTEWWEDEEGVWWYREEGWEDWAVWEE